jgi:hypothetical protein
VASLKKKNPKISIGPVGMLALDKEFGQKGAECFFYLVHPILYKGSIIVQGFQSQLRIPALDAISLAGGRKPKVTRPGIYAVALNRKLVPEQFVFLETGLVQCGL